jgi:hypothetical protein
MRRRKLLVILAGLAVAIAVAVEWLFGVISKKPCRGF